MYFRVELLKIPLFSDSSLWTEDKRERWSVSALSSLRKPLSDELCSPRFAHLIRHRLTLCLSP